MGWLALIEYKVPVLPILVWLEEDSSYVAHNDGTNKRTGIGH